MARKKDKSHGPGSAHKVALTNDNHSTITKANGAKFKLPANDSTKKHHLPRPLEAAKAQPRAPAYDGLQSKSGHKDKAMPQTNIQHGPDQSTDRLTTNKRPRIDEVEKSPDIPDKRPKLNNSADSAQSPDNNATVDIMNTTDSSGMHTMSRATTVTPMQSLPAEVQHLKDKYDFSTMSIISSSKIESRVRNLLDKTSKFSFTKPGNKPEVVILTAKAKAASKMCSIVEIAKGQIEKEKGRYWQYSSVHAELLELKPKKVELAGGRTLADWDDKRGAPETIASSEKENAFGKEQEPGPDIDEDDDVDDVDDDMDEAFETMIEPKERERGVRTEDREGGKKVRDIPFMTIFFARVPVPGLKEIYG